MVDSQRHLDWLAMAKKDFHAAQVLFEHNIDNSLVCFHCQQAIEKYLKGYLLKNSKLLCEGHGLIKLCKMCEQFNEHFQIYLKDVAFINEYYIETRYPADEPLIIPDEDTRECIAITEKILHFIDEII
ncbi:MAG TPA: DNA-binding protein [Firmicutes bacterium]|jgi:HEPN domain-containing protein|nr:DNA-binding protein [Bacillota bacterium]